jgi:hypothetical protein
MAVRYLTSERAIEAAGAAFACVDDDMARRVVPAQNKGSATPSFFRVALSLVFVLM